MRTNPRYNTSVHLRRAVRLRLAIGLCLCGASFASASGRDPAQTARSLAQRVLGQQADQFQFETIPTDHNRDVFEIESRGGRILVCGNNGVSMAVGLNWYLKHYAHCEVSLDGSQLNLPDPLPAVHPKVRRVSWARHRYFLNYCCFGYSLPWWDWAEWEKLIDWMALNGVNLPLSVTGQEAVWQAVCRRLGLNDSRIAAFLAGPPYLPFEWMGCLEGYGGPLPKDWIARHEALEKRILARERELGMTPVLQGFTGHVPGAIARLFPGASLQRVKWVDWETHLLNPLDPLFSKIARMFMEEETRRFGTDHFYAADTFIEMRPPSGDLKYLADLGRAIHAGMAASDPRAVWVLQGWTFMNQRQFWTQPRIRAFLDAIPNNQMVVLDLFCETTPMWDKTEAFCGKPWLWCNVQNFGDTVGVGAYLDRNNDGLQTARHDQKSGRLNGLGFVNEGLGYNPVAFDLMFENAWRDKPVDLKTWIADYAFHRYGRPNVHARRAWLTLLDLALNNGPQNSSAITTAPNLARSASPQDLPRLAGAWHDLLLAADDLGQADTFRYDLVNIARQVLADYAATLHNGLVNAWQAKDAARFEKASARCLGLIHGLDDLLATRREFLLGRWLDDAKRWGATPAERAKCEWNARRVLTVWGQTPHLNDYARKQWSGMLNGYYAPRWRRFLAAAEDSLRHGQPFDEPKVNQQIFKWSTQWSNDRESYPSAPHGDSVAIARRLWAEYGSAILDMPLAKPELESLTTGKPVQCSSALPGHPARLANDGRLSDTGRYWATDVTMDPAAWWQVDLEKPTTVGRVVVVGYYGDSRYYGFTVSTSLDGKHWELAADRRDNRVPSTDKGYNCVFPPRSARYIRITMSHNSANTGRHLVEVMAYKK